MSFLLNTWYLAAWADEVKPGKLFHRRMLDEPVVLYRKNNGTPVALRDRCPHRFAPLSMGKLTEDLVQCPYHGLQFNSEGRCVLNPHGPVPGAARVRQFPVIERYSALWVWMGDPAKADPQQVVPFEFMAPEDWHVGTGHLLINANYELETDNILDLSHIEFLHPLFASEAVRAARVQSLQEGDTVWCKRFMVRDDPPEFIRNNFQIPPDELVDRWLDVRWNAPATMALYAGGVVSGRPREAGLVVQQAHVFTPETANTTHYFYSISFPRAMGEHAAELARESVKSLRGPFELEDRPVIEAVARNMGGIAFWDLKPLLLSIDGAAVLARRILEKKIRAEQSAAGPASG
jgi:phenylpropionate dioxygenase-like ring-hydroxylating dioxygenase large terminal subunit